jgi:kynurenine formamidase
MNTIDIRGSKIIDLSQTIEPLIPVPSDAGVPGPIIEMLLSQAKGKVVNLEVLRMCPHVGTHCDAPYHFYSNGSTVDELPPDCLIGPAVVVDMTSKKGSVPIDRVDIEDWQRRSGESIRPGDAVLLYTGHSRLWKLGEAGTGYYRNGWPYLTKEAVLYLAGIPIRAIGVETFDPDLVDLSNLASAELPTHRTFLAKGIHIIENLTNLDLIPGTRCQLLALPLKIKGGTGSPLRVVAIV